MRTIKLELTLDEISTLQMGLTDSLAYWERNCSVVKDWAEKHPEVVEKIARIKALKDKLGAAR